MNSRNILLGSSWLCWFATTLLIFSALFTGQALAKDGRNLAVNQVNNAVSEQQSEANFVQFRYYTRLNQNSLGGKWKRYK